MSTAGTKWFNRHSNLLALLNYLAGQGESGREIAYAAGKPWKYDLEWAQCCEANDLCTKCGGKTTVHHEDCTAMTF